MKYTTLLDLEKGLDESEAFNHQIKGKRLRKELKNLIEMEEEHFQFGEFELQNWYIKIYVTCKIKDRVLKFAVRLDDEYPFNPPQIFSENQQLNKFRKCKDLLPELLQDQPWGPSLTLDNFIKKIPELAKKIIKKPEDVRWRYHIQCDYGQDELEQSGVQIYPVEKYEWSLRVIKNTKRKFLGLTSERMFFYKEIGEKRLFLEDQYALNQFTDVKATKSGSGEKATFQLIIQTKQKKDVLYLGGRLTFLDDILCGLNPIQMIQKKVELVEKSGCSNYDEAIENYTTLIDYYSSVDSEKTARLIQKMKKIIEKSYSEPEKMIQQHEHVQKIDT